METTIYLRITDDFDARKIYEGVVFYSRDSYNKDKIEIVNFKADNVNHQWREENLELPELKTTIKLTYYSFPSELPQKELPLHTLEIEISGEEEARKKTLERIEAITGIRIRKISES